MSRSSSNSNTAICLLLINKIDTLPLLSIESIRNYSSNPIYIGYLDFKDVEDLSEISNIIFIDLSESAELLELSNDSSKGYSDYSSEYFFSLVQLKWQLFKEVLSDENIEYLVYTDADVLWLDKASDYVVSIFENNFDIHVCVQDATFKNSRRDLCMGFFAMRNSSETRALINECSELHKASLKTNSRIGDDEIISIYFAQEGNRKMFNLLPQMGFPVGSLINAYQDKSPFSGLVLGRPYIFHANYVVGVKRKALLMAHIGRKFGQFGIRVLANHSVQILIELYVRKCFVPLKRALIFFRSSQSVR